MKRIIPLLFALCLLTGCAGLRMESHVTVRPHTEQSDQSDNIPEAAAADYLSLRTALLEFVRDGRTAGRIRINAYDGDVEQDLAEAVYAVTKQEPLGAYAVDYMNYECVRIVSYYEISVHITYRRTAEEIAAVEYVGNTVELEQRLHEALQEGRTSLTMQIASWWEQDLTAMVEDYCLQYPAHVLQTPQVSVAVYPDSGVSRILDVTFGYTVEPDVLRAQKEEVQESISGAAEYIRYRQKELDKAQLLYTYLTGRFNYKEGRTQTPLYGALCAGVADPEGLSLGWQLICERAGVMCHTVRGQRSGEAYTWNVVQLDGVWRHLDLAQCVLSGSGLTLKTDAAMSGYEWPVDEYPTCK